jgi:hypothetical protein
MKLNDRAWQIRRQAAKLMDCRGSVKPQSIPWQPCMKQAAREQQKALPIWKIILKIK